MCKYLKYYPNGKECFPVEKKKILTSVIYIYTVYIYIYIFVPRPQINTQKYFEKYFRFHGDIGEICFNFRVKNAKSKNLILS